MAKNKIPIKKALIWILLSTFIVSGSATGAFFYYSHIKAQQEMEERYTIVAIVQSGSDKGVLKTEYLAELLELSVDQPQNLYSFNLAEAKQKLLSSPLIKGVELKKVKPGTLYINYSVRKPIAFIGDFSNTAIDDDGVLIPFKPFFSPKNIPRLFLGNIDECVWGSHLERETADLVLSVLNDALTTYRTSLVKTIDFSNSEHPSYGQRQIVIHLENSSPEQTRYLRLSQSNLSKQLTNYLILEKELNAHPQPSDTIIIDLRISSLAFIESTQN